MQSDGGWTWSSWDQRSWGLARHLSLSLWCQASPCGWLVWASSQHGSLKLVTLLKWWLRAPRVSVPSDQGSSPMVFHTLASEVTWHAPLMEPVTSPLCFKARKQRPHCLMRKACQRICGHILKCHRNESQEINVSPFFLQAKYSAMHS